MDIWYLFSMKISHVRTIETFGRPVQIGNSLILKGSEPSCFNGEVLIKRHRVTIEEIEEPADALAERVEEMYAKTKNHHTRSALVSFWRRARKAVEGWPDRDISKGT